ncbi:MAG TPA: hypothetical protein VGV12_06620 [Gemmatimonadales bacterium]|nr:hypothetical protein [Gemmatimonadales bacterium]
MIASVVAYDFRGGVWLVLPLAWSIERMCNGLWHLGWTIHLREYSPGLVSSILMWMNVYFILRYTPPGQAIGRGIWVSVPNPSFIQLSKKPNGRRFTTPAIAAL